MIRLSLISGGVLGFLSVALGAFAAHGLKARLSVNSLEIFQTGVQYQFMHGIGLLFVGLALSKYPALRRTVWCWLAGTMIFSGSLYALALTDVKILGVITPFGGALFLLGWLFMIGSFKDSHE